MTTNSVALALTAMFGFAVPAEAAVLIVQDREDAPATQALPLSIEEAVGLAVSRSFRAKRAQRNSAISDLRRKGAKAEYLPRLEANVVGEQAMRTYVEQGVTYDPYANRDFRGGATSGLWMPIDVSGVIKRQVRRAETDAEIAAHEIDQATLDAGLEAENNYLNALRAQENVAADTRVVEQIEKLLEASRARAPGVVPFLQVELGNAQQALTSSRTGADQAQDGLKQTLRMPLDVRLHLTTKLGVEDQATANRGLLERAMALRPDVQQAELRIRQAELAERQQADSRRPSVSINGFMNQELVGTTPVSSEARRVMNRGIGVNVKVPIARYDGGQLSRQMEIASLNKEQAVSDAQELRERVAYDLRQAQLALERAENRIASLPDKKQAFDAMVRAEQQMLGAPQSEAQSLLAQVTNARSAWRSAETAAVDATIDYNRALFRMKRTLGERREAKPDGGGMPQVQGF
jgi:outer membrane protein TolC